MTWSDWRFLKFELVIGQFLSFTLKTLELLNVGFSILVINVRFTTLLFLEHVVYLKLFLYFLIAEGENKLPDLLLHFSDTTFIDELVLVSWFAPFWDVISDMLDYRALTVVNFEATRKSSLKLLQGKCLNILIVRFKCMYLDDCNG